MINKAFVKHFSVVCSCAIGCGVLLGAGLLRAASVEEVLKQVDASTGKAKETTAEYTVTAIVSARATLKDDKVVAFIHPSGAAGLPVLAGSADAALLQPRNEVTVVGKLTDGPLGFAALQIKPGSVQLVNTNKPFGASEPRGADFMKDAAALAGRYVQITNVTFTPGKFDGGGVAKVKSDAGEVTLRISKSVDGREVPAGPVNVFGIPIKVDGQWQLLSARFLPANGKAVQALALKHTCFTCHNPDVKLIGPAYRDVAAKYRSDADAAARLIAQMENGGSGKWGPIPMLPFKGKVPPDDMKTLAEWILGYRWDAILAE